ncbi:MAG: energy transducer TonB [Sideroxydans sp.]
MSAVLSMSGVMQMYSQFPHESEKSSLSERFAVVGLVVLLHLSVFAGYLLQPEMPAVMVNEMSISFANMQMQQADVVPQPKQKPKEIEPEPAEELAPKEVAPPEPQNASPLSPVQLDAEPDYRADYLNNPRPPYPMVARRMGYNGKVILNVEVLAEGRAGQVLLHKSSGYEILDNAALQTVKTWKFSPAKRLGQPVTQWFLVPIKFSLEDNDS